MPRRSYKADSRFFRFISMGAVGARAVAEDLRAHGHDIRELENGSTDTKLWKDVKRKRVRIPDLICARCGMRIESRAKTKRDLSMSHSPTDAERVWDYGMVDSDVVAFPVCTANEEDDWSVGRLEGGHSYWHKRERIRWSTLPFINYFTVGAFRAVLHAREQTKGATEGSETSITWGSVISTRTGEVEAVDPTGAGRISVRRESDGHLYTWSANGLRIRVEAGGWVLENQVLACAVDPVSQEALKCPGHISSAHISSLLSSPERSQRFTGVKLARLREDPSYSEEVRRAVDHPDEDLYVRMEGATYLVAVCDAPASASLEGYLASGEDQTRLEAVVALSEAATAEATELLSDLLDDPGEPYFLRSAAAWGLGRIGSDAAVAQLIRAFADVEPDVREEALEALAQVAPESSEQLLAATTGGGGAMAAGAAEAIRRTGRLSREALERLAAAVEAAEQPEWPVWLLAHLPKELTADAIAKLQDDDPKSHFAIAVLWAFIESWIAPHWELHPNPRANEE